MSASVADLFVVLDSVTDPFSNGMKRAAADAEAQSKRMSSALGLVTKVGLGVGIAVTGIAAASVKATSDFQANMTKLSTAAGAPKAAVQAAAGEILKLGTQVGMTGTQMAEALYHPVSAGLDMATSLQVVKYAAEEAQISGANLDDTTYSLSSVMKAFNFPASQAANTMATLNAVVGDGDMRFQDFNASIKNWAPTAAQMGMSVSSMGAGLAYLTDRGNSAEEASTRLTMGISMMATPSKQAASLLEGLGVASSDVKGSSAAMTDVLKKAGITQNQLAADLAKPDGLYVALKQLQDALHKAGVGGTEADSAIAKIFGGGRSDKAILSLLQNLDGLKQKYDQITADSSNAKFQANWETTKNTFSFQMQQMKVAAENFGIEIGTKLLPVLSNLISTGEGDLGQLASGFSGPVRTPVNPGLGNAFLNKDMTPAPPPLTAWQEFGQKLHQYLTDIENDAKRLEPVGHDVMVFAGDAYQGLSKILPVALSVAGTLGKALFLGAEAAGKVLADVLGPAIRDVGDFIDAHQTAIKIFADVVLGGLALKMGVLGTINATRGLIDLATRIAQFPVAQVGQITTAWDGMKAAWTGKEAAEGEQAIQGLSGALSDLKGKASGALDAVLPNSGKLAGLAQMGQEFKSVGTEAKAADEQLALFGVTEKGVTQVADYQQLSLFEGTLGGVATEAEAAGTASASLASKLGKFAMAGGVIGAAVVGVGLLANYLGHLAGVGDHTGQNVDELAKQLDLAGAGSKQAQEGFTQAATAMAAMSSVVHKPIQGLNDMDTALANLASGGHAAQAKAQFADIAAALAKQGIDAKTAASDFPKYEQAVKDAGDAAQTADGKVQGLLGTLSQQQALDQFASDINSVTTSIQTNGRTLSGNTDQAIANRQAFSQAANDIENYYQQQRNAGVPIQQATSDMQKQVDQLEQTGIKAGMTKGDVDSYLKTLGLIPSSIGTTITANVSPAVQALNGLLQRIDASTGTVQVYASPTNVAGGRALGANADGGPVRRGDVSWVGERGPELVVFGRDGYVIPNEALTGSRALDSRVLSGSGGYGPAAYVPGFGQGGTTVVNNHYNVNFAGDLMTEDQALTKLRTAQLQWSARNNGTGWSVP